MGRFETVIVNYVNRLLNQVTQRKLTFPTILKESITCAIPCLDEIRRKKRLLMLSTGSIIRSTRTFRHRNVTDYREILEKEIKHFLEVVLSLKDDAIRPTSFPGSFPKPGKRPWERGWPSDLIKNHHFWASLQVPAFLFNPS